MALQEHNLSHICSDTLKEVTKASLIEVECVGKYRLQLKNEVGIGHRDCNVKQETDVVKFSCKPTEKEVKSCANIHITLKQELKVEDGEVDIQEHYLSESCQNVQKTIDSSSNKEDSAGEYIVHIKSEGGFEENPRECNFKPEALKCSEIDSHNGMQFNIKNNTQESCLNAQENIKHSSLIKLGFASEHNSQVKNEAGCDDGPRVCDRNQDAVNKVNVTDNVGDGINCATLKQEPEDLKFQMDIKEHHLSESCLNAQEDIKDSSLIKLDFASEHNSQVKNEAGCDDGTRVCNLKQDAVKFGIERPENEINSYNSVQFCIKNNTQDEIQICDGQFHKSLINKGGTHDENNSQDHTVKDDNGTEEESFQSYLFENESDSKRQVMYEHNEGQNGSSKIYLCQFCEYKSKYKHSLNRHIDYKHNENPRWYQCSSCDYKTKTKFCLEKHSKRYHNEGSEVHHCLFCGHKCMSISSLERHIKSTHSKNAKFYQCSSCDYKTVYKQALVSHFKAKHDKNFVLHCCQFCEFKSKIKKILGNHIKRMHNVNTESYLCNSCDYKTKRKSALVNHINCQHNENTKRFHCSSCDFKAKHRASLACHVKMHHDENSEVHQCQFCEFKHKHKYSLMIHVNRKHNENTKRYQCSSCDYKTDRKSSLVIHYNYQHNENAEWYQCSSCDYKTKYKSSLLNHFKILHDENPEMYHCQVCEYKSKNKRSLERHIKFYHNESPEWFQCSSCIYKSKCKWTLIKHCRRKHHENSKL